jgi:DNA-3-methyladenine glycosylase
MDRLPRAFYRRDTLAVARDLLGQRLVRASKGARVAGRIVEVEAYDGARDSASHAHRGPTERNASMFGPPGHAYIYFIYGMHHCFNVVTEPEGQGAAVLVRALEPVEGIEGMRARRGGREGRALTNGPAKLCYALAIDRTLDGADLVEGEALWIERGEAVPEERVARGPRVGVRGDEWAVRVSWRFWIEGNPYVSKES